MDNYYDEVIHQIKVSGNSDGHLELQQCIRGWRLPQDQRISLHNEMSGRGAFEGSPYIIMEAGTAGWGGYNYAYLWIDKTAGYLVTNMVTGDWGKRYDKAFPPENLNVLLEDFANADRPIIGVVNASVDDGPCFFLTIKHLGHVDRFAVYAPRQEGEEIQKSEKIVNRILNFIGKYATQ